MRFRKLVDRLLDCALEFAFQQNTVRLSFGALNRFSEVFGLIRKVTLSSELVENQIAGDAKQPGRELRRWLITRRGFPDAKPFGVSEI